MKALTILQPWAHAIVHFGKRLENRSWAYPLTMKGSPIAIHAGAMSSLDLEAVDPLARAFTVDPDEMVDSMTFGAVVAVAKLGSILRADPGGPQSRWWVGPLAWDLLEVDVLPTPVPCRGYQKLWELPEDVEEWVVEEWAKVEVEHR